MFTDKTFKASDLKVGDRVWVRGYASGEYNRDASRFGWRALVYHGGIDVRSITPWLETAVKAVIVDKKGPRKGMVAAIDVGSCGGAVRVYGNDSHFEIADGRFLQLSVVEPPSLEAEEADAMKEAGVLVETLSRSIESAIG